MNKTNFSTKALLAPAVSMGLCLSAANAFATNQYGIDYAGGAPLSADNITIDSSVSELTPLIDTSVRNVVFSNSPKWEQAYFNYYGSACQPIHYIKVWDNNQISANDNIYYTVSNDNYEARIQINNIELENISTLGDESKSYAIGIGDLVPGEINGSTPIYVDSTCETRDQEIVMLSVATDNRIYVETNVQLRKKGSDTPLATKELYFGLTDIDAAQSYKILNSDSLMVPENMFALSEEDLQEHADATTITGLKNMYVASGNYIYSEYDKEQARHIATGEYTNVFTKLGRTTQAEGVNVVFGFASPAGSGVEFYGRQYTVNYVSDEFGEITDITNEDVFAGETPTGSESTPEDKYEFKHWIADKDITLEDGESIPAGDPISPEQVEQIIVNDDIILTAIHEKQPEEEPVTPETPENPKEEAPAVPNTGRFTGDNNAIQILLPIASLIVIAALGRAVPFFIRKKIKFDEE